MDINEKIKIFKDLSKSIDKVQDIDTKLESIDYANIITGVEKGHALESCFDTALNDFFDYIHKKQAYLKRLEGEMDINFENDNKPFSKISQYKRVEQDVKMLTMVSAFITEMHEATESRYIEPLKSEIEDYKTQLETAAHIEHYKREAEFWHAQALQAYESESYFTGLTLKMTGIVQELKEKITRYQTLFIQKLDLQ